MRKTKYLIPFILLSIALAISLFSCKKTAVPTFPVSFNGATLSWDAVDGASQYTVRCVFPDGTGYSVSTKNTHYACPQSEVGDYLYSVQATRGNAKVLARSEDIVYHLGKGSYADPLLISGVDELEKIGTGSYDVYFGSTKVAAPLHYALTNDIDLADKNWTPIGNSTSPFIGVFDGKGHKITGLKLTVCNADAKVGFFGSVKNAVIKDLSIENGTMLFNEKSNAKGNAINLGLLCGYASASTFDNCRVTGELNILKGVATSGSVNMYAGGVVGQMASGKMFKTSFVGSVYAQYSCVFIGGLIGYATNASPRFIMTNCLSEATVTGSATGYDLTNKTSTSIARVGVLAGSIAGSERIACCLAIGSASASTTQDGTAESSITSGIFGNTAGSSGISSVPLYNLFYHADVKQVSGTRAKLGTGQSAYSLSEEELLDPQKYVVGERSALDFDQTWEMGEKHPVLRGACATGTPLPLSLAVRQTRGDKTELDQTIDLRDAFNPTYHALSANAQTSYYAGFHLNTLLDTMGVDMKTAQSVTLSVNGETLRVFEPTNGAFSSVYFVFGTFGAYEKEIKTYEKYVIIDAYAMIMYDELSPESVEITIDCVKEEEAE